MDGASKFVKGDAIAAIVITLVNLIGGFAVGVAAAAHVVRRGDPDVQPADRRRRPGRPRSRRCSSRSSSGLIVTRAATESDLGTDLLHQFTRHKPRAAARRRRDLSRWPSSPACRSCRSSSSAALLLVLAPRLPSGRRRSAASRRRPRPAARRRPSPGHARAIAARHAGRAARARDRLRPRRPRRRRARAATCSTGCGRCAASSRSSSASSSRSCAPATTSTCRRSTYAIRVHGVEVGRGEAPPGHVLVLGDDLRGRCPARPTTEPVFGLPATWVPLEFRHQAEVTGATVVDRAVGDHHPPRRGRAPQRRPPARPPGREDAHRRRQADRPGRGRRAQPGANSPLGEIQRVLQSLLDEGVGIRDLVRIFEVISTAGPGHQGPRGLVEAVRTALGPAISAAHAATASCRCSRSTRSSSTRCRRRCAPATPAPSSRSTR